MALTKRIPPAQELIRLSLPFLGAIAIAAKLTAAPPPSTRPAIPENVSVPPLAPPTPPPATRPVHTRPAVVSDFPPGPFPPGSSPATSPAQAQPGNQSNPSAPRTGVYYTTFAVRSDLSTLEVVSRRMGWSIEAMKKTGKTLEYDLSGESFQVYVPSDYDGTSAYGLLIWVNFGAGGSVPVKGWLDVLNHRKLIWIGPNMAGNGRYWPIRVGLALDAAANMKSLYRIDPARIYVAGLSGGGRAASMLGVGFPDVFTGGCYIAGCDYYRDVPLGEPGRFWQRNFFPPPRPIFKLAKTSSRHVLFTGEGDINFDQTECNYKAFLGDGFQHVTLFEPPQMGHAPPDPKWFEKGIAALDTPPAPATKPAAARPKPAPDAIPAPDMLTQQTREAESDLRSARLYINAKLYPQARQRLTRILQKYPTTPAAAEARKLLEATVGR
jgi:hypothetical protein